MKTAKQHLQDLGFDLQDLTARGSRVSITLEGQEVDMREAKRIIRDENRPIITIDGDYIEFHPRPDSGTGKTMTYPS